MWTTLPKVFRRHLSHFSEFFLIWTNGKITKVLPIEVLLFFLLQYIKNVSQPHFNQQLFPGWLLWVRPWRRGHNVHWAKGEGQRSCVLHHLGQHLGTSRNDWCKRGSSGHSAVIHDCQRSFSWAAWEVPALCLLPAPANMDTFIDLGKGSDPEDWGCFGCVSVMSSWLFNGQTCLKYSSGVSWGNGLNPEGSLFS
jgi:hypothetical protein